MSFVNEFKSFAMRGNVIDLAVGVIIGGAFGKIVDSMVKDLIMPLVSRLFGGLDFSNYFILLGDLPAHYKGGMNYTELSAAGVPLFAWGNFLTIALNFLILAFVIFMMVRQVNRLRQTAEQEAPAAAPAPVTPEDIVLLREIRDALRNPR
jgi:large conductance mechanosensitive channel